jgi:tripartite ATP-independent transporter DctM subunit
VHLVEWWVIFLVIIGTLVLLMMTGLPVAFCFMAINMVGVYVFWGGHAGLSQLIVSLFGSVSHFSLVTVLLFIFMGEVMFQSGIGLMVIDAVDKWLVRLPGRLGLVAIASGTLLASLSGASMASIAVLGSTLTPEMEKRGYRKPMSLGPILGVSGIAKMIPPSGVGVILAVLAKLSVAELLMAIITPGLIMAGLYTLYTMGRCWLQPSIAPSYDVPHVRLSEKLLLTMKNILPFGLVIFLVTGLIFLGIATPSEAAATGGLGTLILAACYRKLTWPVLKSAISRTLQTTCMVLIIMSAAKAFAQILAFSGATRGLVELAVNLPVPPIVVIIFMQVVALIMGAFIELTSILMITIPIYMPIVKALGFDPLWFGVILLINAEMGATTPPFGLSMFVMKGVSPPDTTMGDIYKAGVPYLACDAVTMALIMIFPTIPLWLPHLMK